MVITNKSLEKIEIKPDPLGLVLPKRMFYNLLLCETESMRKEKKGGIPWEKEIKEENLKEKWLN